MPMTHLEMLWWLVVGHFVADFWAQSPDIAKGKNRHRVIDPASIPPGQKIQRVWPYFLTAHAVMQGAAVALITGNVWLGLAETAAHWGIDFMKCDGYYGIHTDQALHGACKILWWTLA